LTLLNHGNGKRNKTFLKNYLNGRHDDLKQNLWKPDPSLYIVHGSNNTKKDNIVRPRRLQEARCLLIMGKITRCLINNHFTIFGVLGNKGKLDKWTNTYVKSFKL
jgi:hypothetical protein